MTRQGGDQPGRVRRGALARRLDPTLLLAVLLPVVVALALLGTRPAGWAQPDHAPSQAPLDSATVACPPALHDDDAVAVGSSAKAPSGPVAVSGTGAQGSGSVDLSDGVADVPAGQGEVVLTASGTAAPGLAAGRGGAKPLAATDCAPPVADQWFTGLGSGGAHDSVLQLVNPNDGDAVVDVTAIGDKGPLSIPQLRGVAVPGHAARSFDLGQISARFGSMALHAVVSQGQVVASVEDKAGQLAGGFDSAEWLSAQPGPARTNRLLGFPHGGSPVLTVANPGDDQATVTLKIVTPDAVLAPAGAPTVDVPPQTVATVSLKKMLAQPAAKDAYGVEVDATAAVTATLRTVAAGDLAVTTPSPAVDTPSALVLPATGVKTKQVALAGATDVGAVTVISRAADGHQLKSERVAVQPRQGDLVDLPADTALVVIVPERTSIAAAAYLSGNGAASIPFRQPATSAPVPAVGVGLS